MLTLFLVAVPLRQLTSRSVARVLDGFLQQYNVTSLFADYGTEFRGDAEALLRDRNISVHVANLQHAWHTSYCESTIRRMRQTIARAQTNDSTVSFSQALNNFVKSSNALSIPWAENYRRSDTLNAKEIASIVDRRQLYIESRDSILFESAPKFHLNERVRILSKKKPFDKISGPVYSREIYRIFSILPTKPEFSYKVAPLDDDEPLAMMSFYENELIAADGGAQLPYTSQSRD